MPPRAPAETDLHIRHVPLDALRPADYNPRVMPEPEMAALVRSIERWGLVDPIIVRRDDGLVIGGHQRLEAARRLDHATVPVVELDLGDEEARALNIALNRIHGEFDIPKLAEILAALPEDLAGYTGFDNDQVQRVLHEAEQAIRAMQESEQDLDQVPEPPDDPVTQPGDLWVLGRHRLLCGDSGSRKDLDRLLGGASIHLVNTDPPYNVRVEPRSANAIAAGHSSFSAASPRKQSGPRKMRAKDRPLENDFVSDEHFAELLRAWFGSIARVLEPGRAFYIWGGYANVANYPPALAEAGLYFSQTIIWDKQHPVLTRKDFMGAHEWCFYGWREGAAHKFFGPANVPDLWAVKKVNPQAMVHLTEKPVELAVRAMDYSSVPGENVLDLFGGSGSTLVAAETTRRNAYLMELDPAYCDVIVARYEALTGNRAERQAP